MKINKYLSGATIIEVLLVISIVTIILGAASPFLNSIILRNSFDTTLDKLISSIRKAQEYAMDRKNNAVWGICIKDNKIRLYSGSCNSPTFKEDFEIVGAVRVTGLNDTTFSARRGEPSNELNIVISTSLENKTVVLNAAGGISIN